MLRGFKCQFRSLINSASGTRLRSSEKKSGQPNSSVMEKNVRRPISLAFGLGALWISVCAKMTTHLLACYSAFIQNLSIVIISDIEFNLNVVGVTKTHIIALPIWVKFNSSSRDS